MEVHKKLVDLNNDGHVDRITSESRQDESGEESRSATQIEMGLSDGRFIPVYKLGEKSKLVDGESIYCSPQFYLNSPINPASASSYFAEPGAAMGKKASPPRSEPYTRDELLVMCMDRTENIGQRISCIDQATQAPLDHMWQPDAVLYGSSSIPAGHILLDNHYTMDRDHLVSKGELLLPPQRLYAPFTVDGSRHSQNPEHNKTAPHKLRENILIDVKAKRSTDMREYFYAFLEGEIHEALLAEVLAQRWNQTLLEEISISLADVIAICSLDQEVEQLLQEKPRLLLNAPEEILTEIEQKIRIEPSKRTKLLHAIDYISKFAQFNSSAMAEKLADEYPAVLNKIIRMDNLQQDASIWRSLLKGVDLQMASSIPSHMTRLPEWNIKRIVDSVQKAAIRYRLMAMTFSNQHPVEFCLWAVEFIQDLKERPTKYHENKTAFAISNLLREKLDDPANTTPLIKAFLTAWDRADQPPDHLTVLIPEINRLLSVASSSKLPDSSDLLALADRIVQTEASVLVALGKKGDRSPEVLAWIEKIIAGHLSPLARAASAYTSLLLGEKSIPYLIDLTRNENTLVRLHAYKTLMMITATPQVIETLKEGLDDDNVEIRFLAANALMSQNIPEVATLLAQKLGQYRTAKKSQSRLAASSETANVETPIAMTRSQGANSAPTLKQLALFAISKFGQPAEAAHLLKEMLYDEEDETDLTLVAQALITLKGIDGLKILLDRIESGHAPVILIEYASGMVVKIKAKQFAPRLFKCLFHSEERVRKMVASNLSALNDELVLAAIIHHSYNKETHIRLRMAEALAYFNCDDSRDRLIELMLDDDEAVREAAEESSTMSKRLGAL